VHDVQKVKLYKYLLDLGLQYHCGICTQIWL